MVAAVDAAAEEEEGPMCRGIQAMSLMRDPLSYFPYAITLYLYSLFERSTYGSECDTSLTQKTAICRSNTPRARRTRENRRTTSPTIKAPDPRLSSIYIQANIP